MHFFTYSVSYEFTDNTVMIRFTMILYSKTNISYSFPMNCIFNTFI